MLEKLGELFKRWSGKEEDVPFDLIYECLERDVRKWVQQKIPECWEDTFQEIVLEVWKETQKNREEEIRNWAGFIFTIAERKLSKALKILLDQRKKDEFQRSEFKISHQRHQHLETIHEKEIQNLIDACSQELPENHRKTYELLRLGFGQKEISLILGKEVSQVRNWIFRARKELKMCLEKRLGPWHRR